ncbi:MAG: RNA polymerase sigma factor [Chloroflexi bacterium]|nr:RNA polymerase sigma factor [Chloroflexota bacterium]
MEPSRPADGSSADPGGDAAVVAALRRGDEAAFAALVAQHHARLLRLALLYVDDRTAAEEVVQEAWLGLLQGLDRFEERASLKTWLTRILVNRAKTRGLRERRSVPFSALREAGLGTAEPAVPTDRFVAAGPHRGEWAAPPQPWDDVPEARLLAVETRRQIEAAVATLPPAQRAVITLRDIEGWPSDEVCTMLEISETNQRVLLHRARSRVRRALESYFSSG